MLLPIHTEQNRCKYLHVNYFTHPPCIISPAMLRTLDLQYVRQKQYGVLWTAASYAPRAGDVLEDARKEPEDHSNSYGA